MEAPKVINLKPCPFCGTEPTVKHIGNEATKKRAINIKCPNCRAEMTFGAIRYGFDWLNKISSDKWNARADIAQEWVSVDERLPVISGTYWVVVVIDGKQEVLKRHFYPMNKSGLQFSGDPYVTHWLNGDFPLPSLEADK